MLKKDDLIVTRSDLMVAIYDGKIRGGTSYTMKAARDIGKSVYCVNPVSLDIEQFIANFITFQIFAILFLGIWLLIQIFRIICIC